jgi:hypothetical protein
MDWIKRNLLFVIGSTVAVVLMGLAGYYLYSGMGKNNGALEKLNAEYAELDRLNKQSPHPGNDKTDNIKAAREQEASVRAFITKASKEFRPVPMIPEAGELDEQKFAAALRRTTEQMRKSAANAGVQLTTNYLFSFTAERDRIQFDKSGLVPLATQLGEVKVICDVLFAARINALDSIRREKVSVEDRGAQQTTDYLDKTTATNEIAVISPYEVSIRCFSSELAAILSGFASSPHGLVVRAINVDPAILGGAAGGEFGGGMPGFVSPAMNQPQPIVAMEDPATAMARRYGRAITPTFAAPAAPATPAKGGLPTLLDEKQLKATLLIEVVKLNVKNPPKN